jgi:beta-lactamase regulating signal transducer with metallopeptidase domain
VLRVAPASPPSATPLPVTPTVTPPEPSAAPISAPAAVTPWPQRAARWLEPHLPWLVGVWLVGMFALSLWRLGGWIAVQRLRVIGTRPLGADVQAMLRRLADRLRLRRVIAIMQSAVVQTPIVTGWLRPVVLLPVSAVTGLTPAQLEAILAHELAHIRRHDYLVNLLQSLVETVLFYHPAVWWASGRMRAERERCCDDMAVALCGDHIGYAEALAAVVAARMPMPALAAGSLGGRDLLDRIGRILGLPTHVSARSTLVSAVLSFALVIAVIAIPLAVTPRGAAQPSAAASQPTSQPATSQAAKPASLAQVAIETALDIGRKLPNGWTTEAKDNRVTIRRAAPVEVVWQPPSSPANAKPRHDSDVFEINVDFGPAMTAPELQAMKEANQAREARLEELRKQLRPLPHKGDDWIARTEQDKTLIAEFRKAERDNPYHQIPDGFADDFSVTVRDSHSAPLAFDRSTGRIEDRGGGHWSGIQPQAVSDECVEVVKLLGGMFPSSPATRPAGPLVIRVYDVRDLLVPKPAPPRPQRVWSTSQPSEQVGGLDGETRSGLMKEFRDAMRAKVDPPSWQENGGKAEVSELSGNLVVRQTRDNHQAILAWLSALRAQNRMVNVEARFLALPAQVEQPDGKMLAMPVAEQDAQLGQWLEKQLKVKFDEKTQSALIDDAGAAALLKHMQDDLKSQTLAAPRLTMFNGQNACFATGTQQGFAFMPPGQTKAVSAYFMGGTMLDVTPTVADDAKHTPGSHGKYVNLTVHPVVSDIDSRPDATNQEYHLGELKLTVTAPDKATLLLRVPKVRMKVTGLVEVKGSAGAETQYEVAAEPVDKNAPPEGFVYVLIKPTVIIPAEVEDTAAASRPASAPANPPESLTQIRGFSLQLSEGRQGYQYEPFIKEIADTGANTVTFVISAWQDDAAALEVRTDPARVPSDKRLKELIAFARQQKLRVALMPIVLLNNPGQGQWRGKIHQDAPADANAWWKSYDAYILHYAALAQQAGVELLSVGSEMVMLEDQTQRWTGLIGQVRKEFRGLVTYSANWDHYKEIGFWDQLDLAGMTSHYDLTAGGKNPPTLENLVAAWRPIRTELIAWQTKVKKPLLFTEVGWPNQETAAGAPWDYLHSPKTDPQQQKACFEAFFKTWGDIPEVGGYMVWEWCNRADQDTKADTDRSYVLKGKPALEAVRQGFAVARQIGAGPNPAVLTTTTQPAASTGAEPATTRASAAEAAAFSALIRQALAAAPQHASPAKGFDSGVVEQRPTGLDFAAMLKATGQSAATAFDEATIRELRDTNRVWTLCALLDNPKADVKLHAALALGQLLNPLSAPALLAAAKANDYGVGGSENATIHSGYRRNLAQALTDITGVRPLEDDVYGGEKVDFPAVEAWLRANLLGQEAEALAAWGAVRSGEVGNDVYRHFIQEYRKTLAIDGRTDAALKFRTNTWNEVHKGGLVYASVKPGAGPADFTWRNPSAKDFTPPEVASEADGRITIRHLKEGVLIDSPSGEGADKAHIVMVVTPMAAKQFATHYMELGQLTPYLRPMTPPASGAWEWGRSANGLQIRIESNTPSFPAGVAPTLTGKLRNVANGYKVVMESGPELCDQINGQAGEVVIDGRPYWWGKPRAANPDWPIDPGAELSGIRFNLGDSWWDGERFLAPLAPGRHSVQVILFRRDVDPKSTVKGRPLPVASNVITFDVAGAPTTTAPSPQPALLPGSLEKAADLLGKHTGSGVIIIGEAQDQPREVVGGFGLGRRTPMRQAFKVAWAFNGKPAADTDIPIGSGDGPDDTFKGKPADGTTITVEYVVSDEGTHERAIAKGKRVIWIIDKIENAIWYAAKALEDTADNRNLVGAPATQPATAPAATRPAGVDLGKDRLRLVVSPQDNMPGGLFAIPLEGMQLQAGEAASLYKARVEKKTGDGCNVLVGRLGQLFYGLGVDGGSTLEVIDFTRVGNKITGRIKVVRPLVGAKFRADAVYVLAALGELPPGAYEATVLLEAHAQNSDGTVNPAETTGPEIPPLTCRFTVPGAATKPATTQPAALPGETANFAALWGEASRPWAVVAEATGEPLAEDLPDGSRAVSAQEFKLLLMHTDDAAHTHHTWIDAWKDAPGRTQTVLYRCLAGEAPVALGQRVIWVIGGQTLGVNWGIRALADTAESRQWVESLFQAGLPAKSTTRPAKEKVEPAFMPGSRIAFPRPMPQQASVVLAEALQDAYGMVDEEGVENVAQKVNIVEVLSGQAKPGPAVIHYTLFVGWPGHPQYEQRILKGQKMLWIVTAAPRQPADFDGLKALADTPANRALLTGKASTSAQ